MEVAESYDASGRDAARGVSSPSRHYAERAGDENSRPRHAHWRHRTWPPPDTALRLAQFFGNSPEFWLNLQQMHDLSKARLELSKTIEREVEAYAGA
jgi:hypothetical protein